MTPRRALVVFAAVVVASVVADVAPANAVRALAVTPDTNLVGGQQVLVEGSGFTPGELAGACQGVEFAPASTANCGGSLVTFTVDAEGAFSITYRIERFMFVPRIGRWVDCADPAEVCVMGAAEADDIAGTAVLAPLPFAAPPAPPATRGTVTLDPAGPYDPFQPVDVRGTGFRPNAVIDLHQCVAGVDHPSDCEARRAQAVTDASGDVTMSTPVASSISLPGGAFVDCRAPATPCVLALAEAVDFPGTVATSPALLFGVPRVLPGWWFVAEGDSGTTTLYVPVRLSFPAPSTVTVQWNTVFVPGASGAQAEPPGDYTPSSGVVTFAPGSDFRLVQIPVNGDTVDEADVEYLVVSFHDPVGARMGGFWGLGWGGIADDDAPPT